MSTGYINIPPYGSPRWKSPAANVGDLPATNNTDGDVRLTTDNDSIYVWNAANNSWILVASPAASRGANLFNYYNFS
jgi:hypothetical protein